jgi:hypothetical protein
MDSLKQNNVYEEIRGRTLGGEGSPAPDVICEGFTALTWGAKSPLKQFNRTIKTLQRRCSVQPLVGTTAPTQTPDTRKFLCLCTIGLLTLHILANSDGRVVKGGRNFIIVLRYTFLGAEWSLESWNLCEHEGPCFRLFVRSGTRVGHSISLRANLCWYTFKLTSILDPSEGTRSVTPVGSFSGS